MKNKDNRADTDELERQKLINEPGLSWKKWVRYVFLKYWFVFFCMLLDIGIPVQYIENYELIGRSGYYEMVISIISVPFLIAAEAILYRKLFPKDL